MSYCILVIDDDMVLSSIITETLLLLGFEVEVACDGLTGLRKVFEIKPDLILLDIMMPGLDGWRACEQIRLISNVPVIIISALSSDDDVVKGLNLGADDYIIKPLSLTLLKARITAILRRRYNYTKRAFSTILEHKGLEVDLNSHRISYYGRNVSLSPTEYDLLSCFLKYKEKPLPFGFLLAQVWGNEHRDDINRLQLYISYLRKRLKACGVPSDMIHTEWGFGYRFD